MTLLLPENFKNMFPLFESVDINRINFWINLFRNTYDEKIFGNLWEQGCYLYVAHNLFLELKSEQYMQEGKFNTQGVDNISAGVLTNDYKATGPVIHSKAYTNKNMLLEGIGEWGQTVYGQRFFQILKIVGMRILYVPTTN